MWPFSRRKPKPTKQSFVFFGQSPTRDKKLDCIRTGSCPDCGHTSFSVGATDCWVELTCENCGNRFAISPISIERIPVPKPQNYDEDVSGF